MAARDGAAKPLADIERGTTRMEAFSDAFFAIVITILVLDLRPPAMEGEHSAAALQRGLLELWPHAAVFLISFVNIFIMWVAHHELVRITTKADTQYLYLNGGLLLGVALIPLSTAIAAEHAPGPAGSLAAALYTGALLWISVFYNLLWRYVSAHPDRLLPTVTKRDRRRISRTYLVTLALYSVAFALSFVSPLAAIGVTLALAIFFAVIDRVSGFASEDVGEK